MTRTIAIYSPKGGVGKTSLALNLASISAMCAGNRTLLWDLDAHGAASSIFFEQKPRQAASAIFAKEVDPTKLIKQSAWPNFDVLAADPSLREVERIFLDVSKPKRLKKIIQGLAPLYDRIILDCPPGFSELTDQILRAADIIVVPVIPNPSGLGALSQISAYLAEGLGKKPQVMPVVSMADLRKSLHRAFVAEHPQWLVVPQASIIEQMMVKRAPIQAYASASTQAESLRMIWHEVDRRSQIDAKAAFKDAHRGRPRIPSRYLVKDL